MALMATDTLSESGARYLKDVIDSYWKKEGRVIHTWIDKHNIGTKTVAFVVRSDLGLMLPPSQKA
jgi:hypothetical protein